MYKYTKLEKLGEGAHGVVTKARVRRIEEIREEQRREARKELETATATPGAILAQSIGGGATSHTPQKRKHQDDADTADVDTHMADTSDDVELLEPIHLPAPEDTYVGNKQKHRT